MSFATGSYEIFTRLFGGGRASARSAIGVPAIWYALNRISGNLGSLKIQLKKRTGRQIEIVETGFSPRLFKRPSPLYSPITWQQTMTWQAIWFGNGRSFIHRAGNQSELILLDPDSTVTGMVDGEKWHATYVNAPKNTLFMGGRARADGRLRLFEMMENDPQGTVTMPDRDVFHVVGFGDSIVGVPLFEVAQTALENMVASENAANKQLKKGFAAKIMLEVPQDSNVLRTEAEAREFKSDFTKLHAQDGAAEQVALLRGGIKATTISAMSNEQAQFVETQAFQRQNAALLTLVENMIGDPTASSYNSLAEKQLSYLLNCLEVWLTRFEQEADYKLLSEQDFYSGRYEHKFDVDEMLRTTLKQQMETLALGVQSTILNPNEARHRLGLNPYIPEGDEFQNPATSSPDNQAPEQVEEIEAEQEIAAPVTNLVNHFFGIESKQVQKRIDRQDNLREIEDWYTKFAVTFGRAVVDSGIDQETVNNHCNRNLSRLAKQKPIEQDQKVFFHV